MNLHRYIALLLVAGLSLSCSRTASVQKSFDSVLPSVDTISILFPRIVYSEKSGAAEKAKTGHSIYVSQNIAYVLKEIIDEGRFEPKSATILYDSLTIGQWAQTQLSNPNERFKALRDSLRVTQEGKRIFPLTPELQSLAAEGNSRFVLCVDGVAYGTTEHAKLFDMLQRETFDRFYNRPYAYDYQWSGLQVQIAVVDAQSREVLWMNSNDERDTRYDPLIKKDVRDLCLKILKAN
jgi:hypothetical protein